MGNRCHFSIHFTRTRPSMPLIPRSPKSLKAIPKRTLCLEPSLNEIVQVLSVTPFEKVPILEPRAARSTQFHKTNFMDDFPSLCELLV